LAHSLIELLDVDVALFGMLEPGADCRTIRSVALWVDGQWTPGHR
jgi:hypothetical protein